MAGETIKTKGLVLEVRPWSRTSHIVTWLTPDRGPVTTLVKGALRPKSAFLGQYDLFYTCELIYYARAKGELHAIREASAIDMREHLRGNFRATAFASYAAYLAREHCPHNGEAETWFGFLSKTLDGLKVAPATVRAFVGMEMGFLSLAGLAPDFSAADLSAPNVPFAIDMGRVGESSRTMRLPTGAVSFLSGTGDAAASSDVAAAVQFLGLFLRYHLDMPPAIRRNTLQLLA